MKTRKKSGRNAAQIVDVDAQSSHASVVPLHGPAKPKKQRRQSKVTAMPAGQAVTLTREQIEERARALWLESGCLPGRDDANWHEAEAQLKAELGGN